VVKNKITKITVARKSVKGNWELKCPGHAGLKEKRGVTL
jgi:hypothetical protein